MAKVDKQTYNRMTQIMQKEAIKGIEKFFGYFQKLVEEIESHPESKDFPEEIIHAAISYIQFRDTAAKTGISEETLKPYDEKYHSMMSNKPRDYVK